MLRRTLPDSDIQMCIRDRNIVVFFGNRPIGRANNLVDVDELFQTVCAPADDTRDGEHRGVEFIGQVEHGIDEAGIEVHVCTDTLVNAAFLSDDLDVYKRQVYIHTIAIVRRNPHPS